MINNPTRHKSDEARYFLEMMNLSFADDKRFTYNLSAFLSSARSITFHMQKQYKVKDGFEEWYNSKQSKMKQDPELKYLNEARVEEVHKEPVGTGATRRATAVSCARIGVIGEVFIDKTSAPPEDEIKATEPCTVRRFFVGFNGVDVLTFCKRQLDKLDSVMAECEQRFL